MDHHFPVVIQSQGDDLEEVAGKVWTDVQDEILVDIGDDQRPGDRMADVLISNTVLVGGSVDRTRHYRIAKVAKSFARSTVRLSVD